MRAFLKLLVVTLFVFLVFGSFFYGERCVFAQTNQNALKLQEANTAVEKAFNSVLDAEKAGGNVTQLLIKLNAVGIILADVQNTLNSGNTANFTSNLEHVRQIANQVNNEAIRLRNDSVVESQNIFWLTLSFSTIGVISFSISLLLVWRRFKRSYTKKLLDI
jgi:CHASE3 domain sensor protein